MSEPFGSLPFFARLGRDTQMKFSIVTTLYGSAPYVEEFHRRASAAARELAGDDYEIIMVNDGSPDNAVQLAIELAKTDNHMVVVDLSRNFGHHRAMMTGLAQSRGDYVFAIDIDLEEDPELLPVFWAEMQKTGADHVYGFQTTRKGGLFERWSGAIYYKVFNWLSNTRIPPNALMAKLMTRRFADTLLLYRERKMFLGGLLSLTGFTQTGIPCKKKSKGSTTYSLFRKFDQCIDSITSFSARPLYFIFIFGLAVSLLSLLFFLYLLGRKLFLGDILAGWTSLMLLLCLVFGVLSAFAGILGIYIAKIFEEVKQRPYATIRQIWRDCKRQTEM